MKKQSQKSISHSNDRKNRLNSQSGQGLIEYLILVAVIGIGSVVLVRAVGQNINVKFAEVVQGLGGSVEGETKADSVTASALEKKDMQNFLNGSRKKN